MSKDVRIRGYFSKPKRVREQKLLGKIALVSCRMFKKGRMHSLRNTALNVAAS